MPDRRIRYCLNTATIRGKKLPLVESLQVAAKAGYDAIEPWIDEIDAYVAGGGKLAELRTRIADLGLTVEDAIGFFEWIVDDDGRRRKGLDEARRNMEMLAAIGGKRVAAPPFGATDQAGLDLFKAAERYRALLELGDQFNVSPLLEVWGFSKSVGKLSEAMFVAVQASHPRACVLADIYHLYKGGSGFHGLKLVGPAALPVFHVNDYPAEPGPAAITDADRVYPGDGVAPLGQVFGWMKTAGFDGFLSLELFNKTYYQHDALTIAETGLKKLRAVVEK